MFYLEEHKNLEKNELYVYLANSFSKHQNLKKKIKNFIMPWYSQLLFIYKKTHNNMVFVIFQLKISQNNLR